ncbi:hypothetical protein OsJ_14812 [Oryza sativa Japonica Group]|uniref:Uncharacterized protein n=1 Tax=Oryza sativa subsp. japonica TaxID=39947 RepID=A3ATV9_ORYSJ|nr:hypothetical protein OsJ_14812 [Oryza sativa Japonica Group]
MESMSIEEEYISTLHTRSNARFFSRSKQQLSGVEMEAAAAAEQQDAVVVPAELQRMMHRRTSSEIELAMAGYFDASDEASEICRQLLANIKNAQSNYLSMDSFLATIVSDSVAAAATTAPLAAVRSNPFSDAATRSSFRADPRQEQLDTAAKGTYVLGRDLDTVSHLVARLSDGIERENAMARRCAERVAADNVGAAAAAGGRFFPVQEMANELRRSCSSSRKLAEELEEHVCLCLATIHRARLLVIKEISKQA